MNNILLLKKYAISYLSKYNTSKGNLERVLKNKIRKMLLEKKEKFTLYNSISSIITDLESKKFINDSAYADSKIYNFSLQGKSKKFVKSYLIQKYIEKDLIDETINNFELVNPDWEKESAEIFVRKYRLKPKDINNKEKNLAKMARAGFNYNISKKILGYD